LYDCAWQRWKKRCTNGSHPHLHGRLPVLMLRVLRVLLLMLAMLMRVLVRVLVRVLILALVLVLLELRTQVLAAEKGHLHCLIQSRQS
jgi:hypothetical protein